MPVVSIAPIAREVLATVAPEEEQKSHNSTQIVVFVVLLVGLGICASTIVVMGNSPRFIGWLKHTAFSRFMERRSRRWRNYVSNLRRRSFDARSVHGIDIDVLNRHFPPATYTVPVRPGSPSTFKTATSQVDVSTAPSATPHGPSNPESCCICYEDFVEGAMIRILACDHMFHDECISRWLTNYRAICPLCNQYLEMLEHRITSQNSSSSASETTSRTVSDATLAESFRFPVQPARAARAPSRNNRL